MQQPDRVAPHASLGRGSQRLETSDRCTPDGVGFHLRSVHVGEREAARPRSGMPLSLRSGALVRKGESSVLVRGVAPRSGTLAPLDSSECPDGIPDEWVKLRGQTAERKS